MNHNTLISLCEYNKTCQYNSPLFEVIKKTKKIK